MATTALQTTKYQVPSPLARGPPLKNRLLPPAACSLQPAAWPGPDFPGDNGDAGGGSSQFSVVAALVPSKEHIQLGWVVRWGVLSTPPGHPTAGRCVRVVPVLPLPLCTRTARARPSIGGQSPTPAPRQLPWSPPRAYRILVLSSTVTGDFRPAGSLSSLEAPNRDSRLCTASQPCTESAKPPPSPTKSREDGAWACFRRPRKRKPQVRFFGLFHRI
jgi:hypothetical protein